MSARGSDAVRTPRRDLAGARATLGEPSRDPIWRLLKVSPRRKGFYALAISLLVHLVFTPVAAFLGIFAWVLNPTPPDDSEVEQLRSIPITYLGEDPPRPAEETAPALAAPQTAAAQLAQPDPAPSAPATTEVRELEPKPAPPKPAAAAPGERLPKASPAADEIGHPVAMAGVHSELVDDNANVNLLLVSERIRHHPLGNRIGRLLVKFPQWSSFFESAEIDPVRDLDRILIVGPQFRRSADVVAILHHGLPPAVLKQAVGRLVDRPPRGRWLKGKVVAALAHADRAERLFAFTSPNILVVAPPHLERQILSAPLTRFPAPEGDAALILHVKTPWRALSGLPFSLPESIAWLRVEVTPFDDGGAQLRMSAADADPRQAKAHAQTLAMALNAVTNPDLGALGALLGIRSIAFVDRIQFEAHGSRISGQVDISARQLDRLLAYGEEYLADWTGRRDREAPRLQAAPSSTNRSPGTPRRETPVPRSGVDRAPH